MASEWDARTYDRISDPQARWAVPVIERLDRPGIDTILDAGCGTGRVTELMLERFPHASVIGLDASRAMLGEAARRLERFGERVRLEQADLSRPLPSLPAVDAVFSNAVFHWITDHAVLFRNLAAVLRPGGWLIAQWGGDDNVARFRAAVREVAGGEADEVQSTWYFANAADTRRDLEAAGFVDVEAWLHDEPAVFETRGDLEDFMRTVCLGPLLDRMAPDEHDAFVAAVADRIPDLTLDYVRLNATARLAGP